MQPAQAWCIIVLNGADGYCMRMEVPLDGRNWPLGSKPIGPKYKLQVLSSRSFCVARDGRNWHGMGSLSACGQSLQWPDGQIWQRPHWWHDVLCTMSGSGALKDSCFNVLYLLSRQRASARTFCQPRLLSTIFLYSL